MKTSKIKIIPFLLLTCFLNVGCGNCDDGFITEEEERARKKDSLYVPKK